MVVSGLLMKSCRYYITLLLLNCFYSYGQINISGTVFDISKVNYVEGVRIISSAGLMTTTDSLGKYSITVLSSDTLHFFYKGKPITPFPVNQIKTPQQFDIALQIRIQSKYHLLQEVRVFSNNYKQDSLENREKYKDIFAYQKPGLSTSVSPTGVAGADLDELINIFRFRHNRYLKAFQERLQTQEEDHYVDYRFSKKFVQRTTGLQSPLLDTFIKMYRPSYKFATEANEVSFNQYTLNCYYIFWKQFGIKREEKPEK